MSKSERLKLIKARHRHLVAAAEYAAGAAQVVAAMQERN